jgi:hypothetical protein
MLGEPQAWYDRLASAQNGVTVLMAEVEEAGESVWNLVSEQAAGQVSFTPFQATKDKLLESFQGLIVTTAKTPSDAQIVSAENLIFAVRGMVDFVKRMVPEVAAKVDAKSAEIQMAVEKAPLQSPEDVGWNEFWKQMNERSKNLLPSVSTTAIVAVIAGLAGLLYFMKRR